MQGQRRVAPRLSHQNRGGWMQQFLLFETNLSGDSGPLPVLPVRCDRSDRSHRGLGCVLDPSTEILACLFTSSGGEKRRAPGRSHSAASPEICRTGCCAEEAGEGCGEAGHSDADFNIYPADGTDFARVVHDGRIKCGRGAYSRSPIHEIVCHCTV